LQNWVGEGGGDPARFLDQEKGGENGPQRNGGGEGGGGDRDLKKKGGKKQPIFCNRQKLIGCPELFEKSVVLWGGGGGIGAWGTKKRCKGGKAGGGL